jgi:hypothetical protein
MGGGPGSGGSLTSPTPPSQPLAGFGRRLAGLGSIQGLAPDSPQDFSRNSPAPRNFSLKFSCT